MKHVHSRKAWMMVVAVLASAVAVPSAHAAKSIGEIATNLANSFSGTGDAVMMFCWMMAIIIAAASAFKFAAYSREPEREKLSTPFLLLFVAAFFFAIPMVLDTGVKSVWGDEAVKESKH